MQHIHTEGADSDLHQDLVELRDAVGLEGHESTSRNANE
jgi:hypothetical protein